MREIETASLIECIGNEYAVNESVKRLQLLDEVITLENKIRLLTLIKDERYEELKRLRVQDRYSSSSTSADLLPYHKR